MGIRVVVAEDSLLTREGIAQVIKRQDDLEVVALCDDLPSLEEATVAHNPDVVVTDVRMPPSQTDEGIRFASGIRESKPDLGVVVLSQYNEPSYANALLADGSAGRAYLLKERVSEPGELPDAIRSVARGGSVIDPLVVERLVRSTKKSPSSPLAALTKREIEVLGEVAQGKSNEAVARSLVLTERAVEKHINALFAKLGLVVAPDVNRRVVAVLLWLSERDAR
ncbi:MAG TPA: response regulator transcription factor [Frankiaceae bacterium]|jgi:DNA-binding NarL/FixJ family response regulator|nr:response regulator transcription factor [Frankiaceae bacterium]